MKKKSNKMSQQRVLNIRICFLAQQSLSHFFCSMVPLVTGRINNYNQQKMLSINFQDKVIKTPVISRSTINVPEITFPSHFTDPSSLAPPSKIIFQAKNARKPLLSDRVCIKKAEASSEIPCVAPSFQITDNLKLFYVKKMEQIVEEFKKILSIYHNLEKDANKSKSSMLNWFYDLQGTFFLYIDSQQNSFVRPLIPRDIKENLQRPNSTSKRKNDSLQLCHSSTVSTETENLKIELEGYRKSSIEALEKVTEIFEMVKEGNAKYKSEITKNKVLSEAITAYTQNTDSILQKINLKQQKEKKLTVLQREIHQILIKLKFKAFSFSIRQQ